MTFGGYDVERFASGPINWHKINVYENYWQVTMQEFQFKGKELSTSGMFSNKNIIVDSGTSMILLPKSDMLKMFNVLKQETGIECPTAKNLPKCTCSQE